MAGRTSVKVPLEIIIASAKYVGDAPKPEFCNVPNCARPSLSMSLCKAHYHYWQRHKHGQPRTNPDWESILPYMLPPKGLHGVKAKDYKCHVPDCVKPYYSLGLCKTHYSRVKNGMKRDAAKR